MFQGEKSPSAVGIARYATQNDGILRFGRPRRRAAAQIRMIPPTCISPNPHQPRRFFEPDSIASLSDSIRRHGIIQPLTVRALEDGQYELIAGERRLRAAILLDMPEVPCVILEADEHQSAAMAIIENLQRENLNIFEQAAAISSLIQTCSLTQEEVAARLSVSQSFVANKLRLLRYLPDEREMILSASLTERHARALLRLCGDDRLTALREVIARRLNVAETEAYVDKLLANPPPPPVRHHQNPVCADVRLFCNTVNHALEIMRRAGVPATSEKSDTDDGIEIRIYIPQKK